MRCLGSKTSIFSSRSTAFGLAKGKSEAKGIFLIVLRLRMNCIACSERMKRSSDSGGVPITSKIRHSWCMKFLPGNSGLRPSSSAKMQPTLQMSTASVYMPSAESISSGGRYHRVTTCSVMSASSSSGTRRDRPKSVMRRSQFLVTSRFDGLRSRWMTSLRCAKRSPRMSWYMKCLWCASVSDCEDWMMRCRSVSMSSITMYSSSSASLTCKLTSVTMLLCLPRCRSSRTSRSACFATTEFALIGVTFLIATFLPVLRSLAAHTTP
mmetsp:Transcript_8410/g.29889  ORF Transcript_8410/g.29889 Transcript_8410/m.29889 type:complete len:266 (+) Transcript_8410:290-1087(+)